MSKHNVKIGNKIRSKKESPIWIDIGEIFTVKDIIISDGENGEGVLFIDRNGGERVFWNPDNYELIQ